MKELFAKSLIFLVDAFAISLSIIIAYQLRTNFSDSFSTNFEHSLSTYLTSPIIYISILLMLAYEGAYTKRYDFWHETRQVTKALMLSFILVLAFIAITKAIDTYSRAIIIFAFVLMFIFIPLFKLAIKKILYQTKLWQKKAYAYNNDIFLNKEIFNNHYLGYIKSNAKDAKTIFVNSKDVELSKLRQIIEDALQQTNEVIFVPLLSEYDLTQSTIYQLSDTRTNLVVYKNLHESNYREIIHVSSNYLIAIALLPILLPLIAIIGIFIKRESPGPVFFVHRRIGKNGKAIPTLKFRSMYEDAEQRLSQLLQSDPMIKKEWETNFKLKNDPRVSKIGAFLRRTSLDELPQIFNVLRGEMNLVGPRPVIQEEIDQYYKENAKYYFMVKPGITGLWQVSGRSNADYTYRISADKWYVLNWSLWLDIVILFKTVKTVLKKEGAY